MAASDTRLERAEATGNKMLITEPRAVAARVRIGGIKGMRDFRLLVLGFAFVILGIDTTCFGT